MLKEENEKICTGSPRVCVRESEELERCLRYSDLKKFMVDACLVLSAGRLFQTTYKNAVDGETSSNKTSCLSLTSCLGNPCVPPFIISQCE